ncbi:winged helix-turn-helix domain-containing protein [Proteiniphilum acetatigenes]|uniref:winged helix-turn-helix domain-containing protein n=1 Tax=Proteiniphilum acetatigenes TaxID=294710 RepID=UPI00035F2AF3|nr:winged helix-turn-helix domain-containing protein [Proteiniphilum acetatigenes]SFK47143.1 Winged helix-turn-helix domain [Porphyromonadaceae bacterium KH3CP3RA]
MNKKVIGINAGIIWNLLNDYQKWDIPKLSKASGLSEKEVYTAIGWLARENKIEIDSSIDDSNEQFYLVVEYYF